MSFWGTSPWRKKNILGDGSGLSLWALGLILVVIALFLFGCVTQRAWREQATIRYCSPVEDIEEIDNDSWRALCSDDRVMQCTRDVTQPNATYCVEIR